MKVKVFLLEIRDPPIAKKQIKKQMKPKNLSEYYGYLILERLPIAHLL